MFIKFIQKKVQEETTEVDSVYVRRVSCAQSRRPFVCEAGFRTKRERGSPPSRIRILAFLSLSNACLADQVTMDRKASIYVVEL